jgi:hypothetical protein
LHLRRKKISIKPRLSFKSKKNVITKKEKVVVKKKKDIPESTKKLKATLKSKNISRSGTGKKRGFSEYHKITKEYEDYKPIRKCKDILNGYPAFLLGNGPSVSKRNLSLLDEFFTIGINRIFYIYESTLLFWQDRELWRSNENNILTSKAVKICRNIGDPRHLFNHYRLGEDPFRFSGKPHKLYGRGNTGVLSAQFAHGLGCSALVLLGMDCKYTEKGDTDFYGKNEHHKSYTLKMCNTAMRWLKKNSPLPIYNCSENKNWKQQTLEEVIEILDPEPLGKKYFRNLFKK